MKKQVWTLMLLLTFQGSILYAQESMMTEVSYVFLEKLIATAKENYPRVNAMSSKANIAKSNISSQKGSWLDAFSASYIYQPNNTFIFQPNNPPGVTNPTYFNGYQLAFSLRLSSLFKNASAVKQARENLKVAEADEDEYNLALETQVKARYFHYIEQVLALRLQTKSYADVQNITRDVISKYAKGEVTFAEYLQAQVALTTAMQNKVSTEAKFLTAKASLEELLTKKIEEVQ